MTGITGTTIKDYLDDWDDQDDWYELDVWDDWDDCDDWYCWGDKDH